jgi:CIC family chloride channel protein
MIANMSAYALARYLRPVPIYEALLEQDGVHLQQRGSLQALEQLKLTSLALGGADRPRLRPGQRASDLLSSALSPGQRVFPVLSPTEQLLGLVTSEELVELEREPALGPLVTAFDIMRPPASVDVNDSLLAALDLMRAERLDELPVLDAAGHLLGFIDEATIARAHLHESDPKSHPGSPTTAANKAPRSS